ncbi:MAG: hypothetical protein WCK21_08475 [Actinomycetota bacterium]
MSPLNEESRPAGNGNGSQNLRFENQAKRTTRREPGASRLIIPVNINDAAEFGERIADARRGRVNAIEFLREAIAHLEQVHQ